MIVLVLINIFLQGWENTYCSLDSSNMIDNSSTWSRTSCDCAPRLTLQPFAISRKTISTSPCFT